MKYILTGDWHYRSTRPAMRSDDYNKALLDKIKWIVELANKKDARILNAGDMFESPRISFEALNDLMEVLMDLDKEMVMVRGNHDTHFHSRNTWNTPYQTLISAGVAVEAPVLADQKIHIEAMGWGDGSTKKKTSDYCILLAHAQVYKGEPPHYMPDALSASAFIKKNPGFDFYCVGDIHIPCEYKNLIVPGSIMRSTSAQVDYKPAVWLLDTDTGSVLPYYIPIKDNVFDTYKIDRRKDVSKLSDEAISVFVESVDCKVDKPDYVKNLNAVIHRANPKASVKKVVSTIMEGINE